MDFSSFLEAIGIDEIEKVEAYPLSDEDLPLFFSDFDAFVKRGEGVADSGLFFLASYCRNAWGAHDEYMRRGIDDSVFIATFSDIALWAGEYRRRTGRLGLDRIFWLWRHIKLRLFRLGELQFELLPDEAEGIWKDTLSTWNGPVLNVHIPKGTDLDGAEESFDYALSFFGYEHCRFLIHSWLISPEIWEMLGPSSRIRRFASLFRLVGTTDDRQAEERLFGAVLEDPSLYVPSSSLSASAASFLRSGGSISSGYGYLDR